VREDSVVAQVGRHLSKRFLRRIKKRVVILSEAKDLLFAGSHCAFGSLPFQTEPLPKAPITCGTNFQVRLESASIVCLRMLFTRV